MKLGEDCVDGNIVLSPVLDFRDTAEAISDGKLQKIKLDCVRVLTREAIAPILKAEKIPEGFLSIEVLEGYFLGTEGRIPPVQTLNNRYWELVGFIGVVKKSR